MIEVIPIDISECAKEAAEQVKKGNSEKWNRLIELKSCYPFGIIKGENGKFMIIDTEGVGEVFENEEAEFEPYLYGTYKSEVAMHTFDIVPVLSLKFRISNILKKEEGIRLMPPVFLADFVRIHNSRIESNYSILLNSCIEDLNIPRYHTEEDSKLRDEKQTRRR